jgi:type I restriction enzyme M protein
MNLILHGIEAPNIRRTNALEKPLKEIGEDDRYDIIVTNPPFGGEEEAGIQLNFPEATRTSETALLFLQFIMRSLKPKGRCAVVVPNGTLFGDGVAAKVKAKMLTEFNLHTIVRLPSGVFAPYTSIPTNLLFFDRTGPTTEIWYYEQPMPEGRKNYSKTKPLQFEEFAECAAWWTARVENERAWKAAASEVVKVDADGNLISANLDIKNPNVQGDFEHLPPEQLAADILKKEHRIAEIMAEIQAVLGRGNPA